MLKLRKKASLFLTFAMALILTGCGTTPNYFMPAQATKNINSTDVIVSIPQKELYAQVNSPNTVAAAGGGLLFALIDAAVVNARANTAESAISPIKDALIEEDFNQLFASYLNEELANIGWLNLNKVKLSVLEGDAGRERAIKSAQSDAVMLIDVDYSLGANFNDFEAKAQAVLLPKNSQLKQFSEKPNGKYSAALWHPDNALYRDTFLVRKNVSSLGDVEDNASSMVEDKPKLVERFRQLAQKLAKSIAFSIKRNGSQEAPTNH